MSVGYVPNPLPFGQSSGVVKGRVVDADTGLGMPGVTVGYGSDTNCVQFPPDAPSGFQVRSVTNSSGYYPALPSADLTGLNCAGILGTVTHNSDGYSTYVTFVTFHALRQPRVTATPSTSRAGVGTAVAVNGQVFGGVAGCKVYVQQLHGSTQWLNVSSGAVRTSLRWSATAPLTVRGMNIFRAVEPVCGALAQAISASFRVTGT
ncbi:MAG: hypothetical protein ACHQE5_02665 [Actinomycetes bacterium]